ncbi:MAG: PASTA domain-containing protein [Firmicutes bacterium]|nr:PASTA domain-containing protein [Bacillota bacterium]
MAGLVTTLVRKRVALVFLAVSVSAFLLTTRLAYVQVVRHRYYTGLALDQRLRGMPADPLRGPIYDRNMTELATSVSSDAVYVRPAEIRDASATAFALAGILGHSYEQVLERITRRQAEVWIARRVSEEQARRVLEAGMPGVYLAQRTARVYPHGTLASHVIGIVGVDNQGLEGIELQYDELLRGVPGRVLAERDARGRIIPKGMEDYVPPRDGMGIVLTIDAAIQAMAERELAQACIATLSEFCMTIWMDPASGEILAMAVYPTFDPNAPQDYPAASRRNRTVTDQFEPGSIFKIATAVAALEEGVVMPDEQFYDAGYIEIGGGRVRCWRGGGHGSLTFARAVEVSCNPVFAELGGLRMGPSRFYPYLEAFGFGDRLGVDYPGEARGLIPVPGQVAYGEVLRWANVGFGQGVAVTPLQMVTALAAIANDGVRMWPHLVRGVVEPETGAVQPVQPQPVQRVVSEATARTFMAMLRDTVVNGSGANADIPGYLVGGKTGTAQVAEGGVYTERRMASFLGVAPVDDPRLAGIVILFDLKPRPAYGGVHAAPVWRAIAAQALPYLGVIPREPEGETPAVGLVRVPNVQNLPLHDAEAVLSAAGLQPVPEGIGTYVLDQVPAPGAAVELGTRVLLEFYEVPDHWQGETTVPSLAGRPVREAARVLAEAGLVLEIQGEGVAVSQDPAPGQVVLRGTRVSVQFSPEVEK